MLSSISSCRRIGIGILDTARVSRICVYYFEYYLLSIYIFTIRPLNSRRHGWCPCPCIFADRLKLITSVFNAIFHTAIVRPQTKCSEIACPDPSPLVGVKRQIHTTVKCWWRQLAANKWRRYNLQHQLVRSANWGRRHGGRIYWRRPNAQSVAFRGGLRFLRLAEFVTYNRAAIGGPSKRQPMNSLVSSCLGSTCYPQTPFARYWRDIKAAANEITSINLPRLNANSQSYHVDV